jgi:ubiquinol-cytochrome c reductase cytochrome c subunit
LPSLIRSLLKNRYLIPAGLVAVVAVIGLASFGSGAGGASNGATSSAPTAATNPIGRITHGLGSVPNVNFNGGVALPQPVGSPNYLGGRKNSGGPNSSIRIYRHQNGHKSLVAYGNSSIIYKTPPASYIKPGAALFAQNCAVCHGPAAEGTSIAPNLIGVGPATVDFWVSTGRMPATSTAQVEATRKPPRLNKLQSLEVAAFVNSLDPAVPFVPYVNLKGANLSKGASLFALNCAACHTITGAGDALAFDTFAPSLRAASPQQVAEAIRTGPANMPRFTGNLSDSQVRDVVAYVTKKIQHPSNPGGAALGGVGPVAEGFIALLIGVGGLVLIAFWIGDRA